MGINYQNSLTNITSEQLSRFCVGWKYPISGAEMYEMRYCQITKNKE